MSLDVTLTATRPTQLYSANITHNLNKMADAAGIYKHLWRPDEIGITKRPKDGGKLVLWANGPGERASFWRVYLWWVEQGKALDADGFCVWAKPPEPKLIHMGGRHYRVVYP